MWDWRRVGGRENRGNRLLDFGNGGGVGSREGSGGWLWDVGNDNFRDLGEFRQGWGRRGDERGLWWSVLFSWGLDFCDNRRRSIFLSGGGIRSGEGSWCWLWDVWDDHLGDFREFGKSRSRGSDEGGLGWAILFSRSGIGGREGSGSRFLDFGNGSGVRSGEGSGGWLRDVWDDNFRDLGQLRKSWSRRSDERSLWWSVFLRRSLEFCDKRWWSVFFSGGLDFGDRCSWQSVFTVRRLDLYLGEVGNHILWQTGQLEQSRCWWRRSDKWSWLRRWWLHNNRCSRSLDFWGSIFFVGNFRCYERSDGREGNSVSGVGQSSRIGSITLDNWTGAGESN